MIDLLGWACAGYLTQAQGLITTDASRASFISTFTVRAAPPSLATETSSCMRDSYRASQRKNTATSNL